MGSILSRLTRNSRKGLVHLVLACALAGLDQIRAAKAQLRIAFEEQPALEKAILSSRSAAAGLMRKP